MHFKDRATLVKKGELIFVPRGVEHKPVANNEAHILLVHGVETANTGNVVNDLIRSGAPKL